MRFHFIKAVALSFLSVLLIAGLSLGPKASSSLSGGNNELEPGQSTTGPVPPPGINLVGHTTGVIGAQSSKIISGFPSYLWIHGCGPTAAGMVLGYYDSHGFPALLPGDGSTQTNDINLALASTQHYDDYCVPRDDPPGPLLPDRSELPLGDEHADNCLADFLKTSQSYYLNPYGWGYDTHLSAGFPSYVSLVSSYTSRSTLWGFNYFSWEALKFEIDRDRPLVFLLDTDGNNSTDHIVPVFGYKEEGGKNYFACFNTWDTSVHWYEYRGIALGTTWGIYSITTFFLGTTFYVPFGSLDNGNVNIANGSNSQALTSLKVRNASGAVVGTQNFTIPPNGVVRSWDLVGNIYNFGKPVTVEIGGNQVLLGDNIKWASPPYDTVGAGFTCGSMELMKGKEFYFPFSSAGGWANGYCVITNTTDFAATGMITVYNQMGGIEAQKAFALGSRGIIRSWDIFGVSLQAIADPALVKVTCGWDVVVEAVRWEQNRRGWGFAVFPSAKAAGNQFILPFASLDNGNVNLGNIADAPAAGTLFVRLNAVDYKKKDFMIPPKGVVRSWDILGNIYDVLGKPVQVEVISDMPLVADNIKWANPPYETIGAGFSCAPLPLMGGTAFAFPFSSFAGWTNAYCVMTNPTGVSTGVILEIYNSSGTLVQATTRILGPRETARSWDWIGNIRTWADPALVKIRSERGLVVETVRWEENRRGWGFAVLPILSW